MFGRWQKLGWLGLAIWLAAVSAGMGQMFRYSTVAGASGPTCGTWPREWSIQPSPSGVTLVVALHPRCPCSRATLGELSQIMTRRIGGVHAIAMFVRPTGTSDDWEHTDLWKQAESIPGVTAMSDPGGAIAEKFGAFTSGQVSAFDAHGNLLFQGGITPARGDMGDNAGADALNAILLQQHPQLAHTPVFGCPLTERTPR